MCTLTVMVEGLANEIPEDTFCEAVLFAHREVHDAVCHVSRRYIGMAWMPASACNTFSQPPNSQT